MDSDKIIRRYVQPYLSDYHQYFEDFCFLIQASQIGAAARLLVLIADSEKTLPSVQNKQHLQEYTEEYLKCILHIGVADLWVASDYTHSIRAYLKMDIDPASWLIGRIDELRQFLDSKEIEV